MTDSEKTIRILDYAQNLMKEYGLSDWKLELMNGRRVKGQVAIKKNLSKSEKIIRLSRFHILHNTQEEMENTVRHEIAHAIDFNRRGKSSHDQTWKLIAQEVGAVPKASCNINKNPLDMPHKYEYVCLHCGWRTPRYRKRARRNTPLCPDCYKEGREQELMFLEFRDNITGDKLTTFQEE